MQGISVGSELAYLIFMAFSCEKWTTVLTICRDSSSKSCVVLQHICGRERVYFVNLVVIVPVHIGSTSGSKVISRNGKTEMLHRHSRDHRNSNSFAFRILHFTETISNHGFQRLAKLAYIRVRSSLLCNVSFVRRLHVRHLYVRRFAKRLSSMVGNDVFIKREDLQPVHSYPRLDWNGGSDFAVAYIQNTHHE